MSGLTLMFLLLWFGFTLGAAVMIVNLREALWVHSMGSDDENLFVVSVVTLVACGQLLTAGMARSVYL